MEISNKKPVQWIGEQIKIKESIKSLKNKEVKFYQKCIFGKLVLSRGDCVLVSNADSDPDDEEDCDIGRILYLFEIYEPLLATKSKPFRAIVQWYSRPKDIPHKNFDNDDISIDFDREVIEDHTPYENNISITTIVKKCSVIIGDSIDDATVLLEKVPKAIKPMFACRFKFIKTGSRSFKLVTIGYMNPDEESVKTPKRRKSVGRKVEGLEFVDIGNENTKMLLEESSFDKENIVSPLTIINKSIVKSSSKKSDKKLDGLNEINANYLKSPAMKKLSAAKRNLNISLDGDCNSSIESDCLNYSIVTESAQTPVSSDPLKIKLRLSEKQTPSRRMSTRRQSRLADDIEAATPSSSARTERDESGVKSNTLSTPVKTKAEDNYNGMTTPLTGTTAARRKSILKTPGSKSAVGTPKRSIQLTNIVEEKFYDKTEAIISTPSRKRGATNPRKVDKEIEDEYTPSKRKTSVKHDEEHTPSKKKLSVKQDEEYTPSKKRTSVKHDEEHTPNKKKSTATPSKKKTPSRSEAAELPVTPSRKRRSLKIGDMTPTIERRENTSKDRRKSNIQITRERLHVSAIPTSLPCRETEFNNIYQFLEGKIQDQCGGCMYISGVPGTGKTATVTGVIRELQNEVKKDELLPFDFIEINGMRLTEPRQAYVEIYKKITGKSLSWEQAHSLLEKRFTTPAPHRRTIVLLVDELDILCNRRQDVVYNLLDWPTKSAARLVVVTIANTMDLPERLLMGKVTSRLGLTRLTFQPYTHKQLQEIVTARICGSDSFKSDAVQLVARKVAAVSGDCRRALDICRRATEIADTNAKPKEQVQVNMVHVQQALTEMIASPKVQAIKCCSKLEKIFLQGIVAEITRTGVEETMFLNVFSQIETIARFLGHPVPTTGMGLKVCSRLASQRLVIGEQTRNDLFQKIILNVSKDDIHFALQVQNKDLS